MASYGSKRKANLTLEDLVAETLECPRCLQTIQDPPVFLCTNGHELCYKCREQLKAEAKPCPVCQGELLDVRNRAVEKMLEKLPRTECKYEGCTFARSNPQLVKSHEERECRMKPVTCEDCFQPMALSELFDHMVDTHQTTVLTGLTNLGEQREEPFKSKLNWSKQLVAELKSRQPLRVVNDYYDLKFFVNWKSYDENTIMFWVSFSGTQKEAEDFEYELKIVKPPGNRVREPLWWLYMDLFSAKRGCVSCDGSGEEKGDVVFLNKALLERAASKNDGQTLEFYYYLMIDES